MVRSVVTAETLGVDIGGVIIDRVREDRREGTLGVEAFTSAAPVTGALASLARLVGERFGDRVWLVSRCDATDEGPILDWLARHRFFAVTGVAFERVRFCRERSDKAAISAALGITHFVDDRLEVLGHLVGRVPNLYWLRSRAADDERFAEVRPHVHEARGWREIVVHLLR